MFGKKKILPYGTQFVSWAEYYAVWCALKSKNLTQGPYVEKFEQALQEATSAPYAVAVANGTLALDLAVRAVKLRHVLNNGALALTTPNTFVASSNALLYNQFEPIFCDISPVTYNLDLKELERWLKKYNEEEGGSIEEGRSNRNEEQHRATIELLLPVHFAGETVDMPELWRLAQEYGSKLPAEFMNNGENILRERKVEESSIESQKPEPPQTEKPNENLSSSGNNSIASPPDARKRLSIIEDASHAIGSSYPSGERVGSCAYSDACCFSFHPVKSITTAEGGAITCRDPELYQLLLLLRNHGINRTPEQWLDLENNCQQNDLKGMANEPPNPPFWYYEMQTLGHNARLSDVHAALGIEQLKRLNSFAEQRRELAAKYMQAFQGLQWLTTPCISAHSCPHLYVVQIDFAFLRLSRNEVMRELYSRGIGSQVHYIPVPMQPFYRHLGYEMKNLEHTQKYYQAALSLPLYPSLRLKEQERVIESVCGLARP